MSQKTKTITKETEEVSEHDNPAVLAYRVGQLEIKQEKGFAEVKQQNDALIQKIDNLAHNFATKADLEQAQRDADKAHLALEKRLEEQDVEIEALKKTTDGYPLVKKLVLTAAGIILLTVLGVIVNLAIKGQAA